MTRNRLFLGSSVAALFLLLPVPSGAQSQPPSETSRPAQGIKAPGQASRTSPPAVRTITEAQDARETRRALDELFRRYSPTLGAVLKLDPTLLGNPEYLAPYPGLAEFLAEHPEVARDPAYFFENVDIPWVAGRRGEPMDPRQEAIQLWRSVADATMVFIGMIIVTITLAWLIKTLIDYRRWSRLSKVQADVHNKVLDRFGNNDELLAYVQTPAGQRFLESAPIALDPVGPAVATPLRRILWAVEAGFVLIAGGVGLQYVSGQVPAEVSPMLLALGVLGVALGIGFVVAAGASFLISKRLGLFPAPAKDGAPLGS